MNDSDLIESIEYLTTNYNENLTVNNSPNPKIQKYIQIIEENKHNPLFHHLLNNQSRPTSIQTNTVGAYLWGCRQNFYGQVSKACSCLCAESFENNKGLGESFIENVDINNICQYQIWSIDSQGGLDCKRSANNSQAYIYVGENWKGLTEKNLETLKFHGIDSAAILLTKNSQHFFLHPMKFLDFYPTINERYPNNINISNFETENTLSFSNPYILLIILILITIFIFYLKFYKKQL
jgi:hypothetical protein